MRIKNQDTISMQTIYEDRGANHSVMMNKTNDNNSDDDHHNDMMMKIKNAMNDHYKSSPLLITNNLPVAIESHETPLSLPRWTIELPPIIHQQNDQQHQGPLTERYDRNYNFNYHPNNNSNHYYRQNNHLSEGNGAPNTTPTPYRKIDNQHNQKKEDLHHHHQDYHQTKELPLRMLHNHAKLSDRASRGSELPMINPLALDHQEQQHMNNSKNTIPYDHNNHSNTNNNNTKINNNAITTNPNPPMIVLKPTKHHPLPPIDASPSSSSGLFHQSPSTLSLFCNLLAGGFFCQANFSNYSENNDYPLIIIRLNDKLSLELIDAKKKRSWTNNNISLKNIKKIVEMKSTVLCIIIEEDDDNHKNNGVIINNHNTSIFLEFPSSSDCHQWYNILSSISNAINTPSLYNILSTTITAYYSNNTNNNNNNNTISVTNTDTTTTTTSNSSSQSLSFLNFFCDYSNRFASLLKKQSETPSDHTSLAVPCVQSIREKLMKLSTMGAEREEDDNELYQTPLSCNNSNNNDSYNNSKSISNYNNNNNNNDNCTINSPSVFDTPVLIVPLSCCTDSCLHGPDVQCGNISTDYSVNNDNSNNSNNSNNRTSDDDSYDGQKYQVPSYIPWESNTAINHYTPSHNNHHYNHPSNPLPLSAPPLRPLHRSVSFHPSSSILRSQIASMQTKLLSLEKEWTRLKKDRVRLTGDSDYKIFYLKSRIKEISAQNHALKKIAVKKRMEEARKVSNYL